MGTEVDSLEVKISASAEQANQSLDKLIRKLDTVTSSIMGVSKNAQGMGASFKFPNLNNIAKGIDAFSKIDTSSITKVGDRMRELASEFQTLNNVNFGEGAKQFVTLANSVSRLGNKSTTKALDVMPKIAPAINAMMAGLQGAPVVSQNLIEMTNAVAKLARTGSSGGKTVNSLVGAFNRLPSASNTASKSLQKVQNGFRSLTRQILPFINLFALIELGKKSVEIASDLAEIQNVVDVTFGKYSGMVEKMASTSITDFGMSEKTVKDVASRFQAMGTAMGFAQGNMADMSIELTKLTGDMASFYNVSQKDVAKDLESIFTGETRPMRQYGVDLTEATLKEWAMKQGLDANISSMTQAEKAMLRYQYVLANTTNAQGDFARTADSFSNQVRILKQNFEQLGAIIGGTFINMLKPLVKALNSAMGSIISFAQTISNALGKIFGWKFEVGGGGVASDLEDGAGYADDLSGSLGDAEQSAKKLKSYLLGIDELNILDNQEGTSSSGGSGTSSGGGASGGEWTQGESIIKSFESEIDSLFELGRYISDTLSKAMESIDWESVYEKARGFGTGLAQFLNGLITPRLFGNIGITLANSLNTVFEGLNAFAIEFDWSNLGVSVATGIDNFFESWDAGLSAEALSNFASGILQSLSSYIGTLKNEKTFNDIGQKLVDFICGVNWSGLAWDLSEFFTQLSTALVEFPTDFGLGIAEAMWESISGQEITLEKPKWLDGLGTLMLNWISPQLGSIALGGMIQDALYGSGDEKKSLTDLVDFEAIKEKFTTTFTTIKEKITTTFDSIKEKISNVFENIREFFSPVIETIEGFQTRVGQIFEGISIIVQAVWIKITDFMNENVFIPIKTKFDEIYLKVAEVFENCWTAIQVTWLGVATWFTIHVTDPLKNLWNNVTSAIGGYFDSLWEGIKKGVVGAMNAVLGAIEDAINWIVGGINDIIGGFNKVVSWAAKVAEVDWGGVDKIPTISIPKIPMYFTGGFPQRASLFWAGENGVPEIAGTIGGRTAVASGAEITGIRDAVYNTGQAEVEAIKQQNELLNEILNAILSKNLVVGDREVVESYERGRARMGHSFTYSHI